MSEEQQGYDLNYASFENSKNNDTAVMKNHYNLRKDPMGGKKQLKFKIDHDEVHEVPVEELDSKIPNILDDEEDKEEGDVPLEVKELIDSTWSRINDNIAEYIDKYKTLKQDNNTSSNHKWKTVRIFISSTFTDFFAEREAIVKKVRILLSGIVLCSSTEYGMIKFNIIKKINSRISLKRTWNKTESGQLILHQECFR